MAGSVTVRVQDGNGDAVEGAAVQIVTGRKAVVVGLETDSNGETGPWKVAPGRYTAKVAIRGYEVSSAATVTVADTQSKTIDVTVNQLPYQTSGTVSGPDEAGVFGIDRDVGTGVYGASPSGYGLETPDDAKVGGRLEVGGLDVADTLPHYGAVGDDPARIQNALTMLFTEDSWSGGHYRSGTTHGETTPAFQGSVLTRDGEVVLIPYQSDNFAIYDPDSNTYTQLGPHVQTKPAFSGGTITPSGDVVFAPHASSQVGVYNPELQDYDIHPHDESAKAFSGAVLAPNGKVVFAPYDSGFVGLFDPSSETYTRGTTHGSDATSAVFSGATLTPYGEVVFVPYDSEEVGIYDPASDTYKSGPEHGDGTGTGAYAGATLTPAGEVVMAPHNHADVAVLESSPGYYFDQTTSHGQTTPAFHGATLAPTGDVILAPYAADNVGIFDTDTGIYTSGPSHGRATNAFAGVTLTPSGRIVFAAYDSVGIDVYETDAQTIKADVTVAHPLLNNS